MELKVYDTSALLDLGDSLALDDTCYISTTVISELENIKTSFNKDSDIKYKARQVMRILRNHDFKCWPNIKKEVEKLLKKYKGYLEDKADSRILLEALYVSKTVAKEGNTVKFFTGDYTLYMFAKNMFSSEFTTELVSEITQKRFWDGFVHLTPTEQQWSDLYNLGIHDNIFNLKTNEYAILHDAQTNEVNGICRWDGENYVQLGYTDIKSPLFDKISPRNIEQKCYFDLLQNPEIPIVNCIGRVGSGKTFLAIANMLYLVDKGQYDKIIYVRNNFGVEDTRDPGSLPGSLEEKLRPFLGPLIDIVGSDIIVDSLIEEGKVEQLHLGYLRGKSVKNAAIITDESQNLTPSHVKMLISRMAENSKLIFCGDYSQIDSKIFRNQSNGLLKMDERLRGNKLYGQIRLNKIERSKVCQLADLLD